MRRRLKGWLVILSAAAVVLCGCTQQQYAGQADRAAYRTLARGQRGALGGSSPFDVAYEPFRQAKGDSEEGIRVGRKIIPLGGDKPQILTLEDCLWIAFRNSRDFQDQKEALYRSALNLANTRRSWNIPLLEGLLEAEASHTRVEDTSEDNAASAAIGPTLTQRFIHGGVLTLAATLGWATDFVSGSSSNVVGSLLEANLTQPLLRGAWRGLAYEDQYRLERDFLFTIFEYDRFRQTFAAGIFEEFYEMIQRRDRLENERQNIKRLEQTHAFARVQAEAGQISRVDENEAKQNLLNAKVNLELIDRNYHDALDSFKITLALPIQANVELDYETAKGELLETGTKPIGFGAHEAIAIALSVRPDVLNERANLRDADRNVEIAADRFYPQLDVEVGISASGTLPRKFHRIRFNRHERFARVTFDYELDQTDNRDDYRLAMIAYDKARRDLEEFLDGVRLEVRQSYRELVESKRSYELQLESVHIAIGRRKLVSMERQQGRANTDDVLRAESSLLRAQNGMTGALIRYTTTRVQFLATLGMIEVDERGMLHERAEPFRFDRISKRYSYLAR